VLIAALPGGALLSRPLGHPAVFFLQTTAKNSGAGLFGRGWSAL